MARLSEPERKIFQDLVEQRVGDVWKYRSLVNALVALHAYFLKSSDYQSFLGAEISGKTPDIVIKSKKSDKVDIIGDGKNGLPTPRLKRDDEDFPTYFKSKDVTNYLANILGKLNAEIAKYSIKLDNITDPHDFFTLCPIDKITAIKLLQKDARWNEKAILLTFNFTQQGTKYAIRIGKETGTFTDSDLNNQFEMQGIFVLMDESEALLSKHKLYLAEKEDEQAPIEWIMLIIWQYILPELAQTNRKEMIIATLKNNLTIIEITLKQVSDFIKSNYKLPMLNGEKTLISDGVIKKALKNFESLTDVQIITTDDENNPKYRIVWKKLSGETLLQDFVKHVHEEEFAKIARIEAARANPVVNPPSQTKLTDLSKFEIKP